MQITLVVQVESIWSSACVQTTSGRNDLDPVLVVWRSRSLVKVHGLRFENNHRRKNIFGCAIMLYEAGPEFENVNKKQKQVYYV